MNEGQQRIGRTAANGVATIDPNKLPQHVAIIMDGNGRWAQNRGSARTVGHRAGVQNLRTIVRASVSIGIPMLTVFAFSTENWERPPEEVAYLMKLLDEVLSGKPTNCTAMVSAFVIGARTGYLKAPLRAIEAVERRRLRPVSGSTWRGTTADGRISCRPCAGSLSGRRRRPGPGGDR